MCCRRWRALITLTLTLSLSARPGEALLQKLLHELHAQHPYETLLVEQCQGVDDATLIGDGILQRLQTPTVLTTSAAPIYWKTSYNNALMAIVCLERSDAALLVLDNLAAKLQHIRETRIVLLLHGFSESPQSLINVQLQEYFKYCALLQMLNVVALLTDFTRTQLIYAFDNFPEFRLLQHKYGVSGFSVATVFPNKLHNVHGHVLYTLPDQLAPRSFLLRNNKSGELQLAGYMSQMLQAFAALLNATLRFPFPVQQDEIIYVIDLHKYTDAGIIDIACGLGGPKGLMNVNEYSDYVELAWWMPMLPVERNLEVHEMFLLLFRSELVLCLIVLAVMLSVLCTLFVYRRRSHGGDFWRDLLMNDKSLRGILAQSFPMSVTPQWRIGFVFTMIFVTGLLTSTLYGAYLNSFLTEPPTLPRIKTFDDLQRTRLKIMMWRKELSPLQRSLGAEAWTRYKDCFLLVDSWAEFLQHRSALNMSYAYMVTQSMWPTIEQLQLTFQRKVFRVSADIVVEKRISFSLPVQQNSVYKPMLNRFVLNVHQAGLLQYWRQKAFFDMVSNGTMSFMDFSHGRSFNALVMKDFYGIWLIYGGALGISIVVFLAEFLVYRREVLVRRKSIVIMTSADFTLKVI